MVLYKYLFVPTDYMPNYLRSLIDQNVGQGKWEYDLGKELSSIGPDGKYF